MSGPHADVSRLTWPAVWARRLEQHALSAPVPDARPAEVVSRICGAHAQMMSAAELSIGLRLSGITRTDVHEALWIERSLVKTFGPRGTVHLLPTQDLPLWTGALSALPPVRTGQAQDVRLTPAQTDAIVAAIAVALEGAELTVEELGAAVISRVGPWAGDLVMPAFNGLWPRWRQALAIAAYRGTLCFGPNRGRNVTYTAPHRWLPGFRPVPGQAALTALVLRYLHAYGPATPHHVAQWLGTPQRWVTEVFASLSADLQPVEVDGTPAWMPASDTMIPSVEPTGVRLLPYFDAYTVGCHPRALLFPGHAAARALSRTGQAGTYPVLLINGTVAGIWRQHRSGRTLDITVEPFDGLTAVQCGELDSQVQRIGRILEATPHWAIGPVTVGSHA